MKQEERVHISVCQYLKWQYPDLLWVCDYAAGIKLNIGQAVKAQKLRSCRGLPDIFILRPNKYYHGLFIELKTVTPFKKDGSLKAGDHLAQQNKVHEALRKEGYYVAFAVGFDQAKAEIDYYLKPCSK